MRQPMSKDRNSRLLFCAVFSLLGGNIGCSEAESRSEGPTYCEDVRPIVEEKCVRCHAETPKNGAPFSLTTYADFQQPHPVAAELEVGELAISAIESGRMPATSVDLDPKVEPLTKEEKKILLEWLDSKRERGDCSE